MSTSEVNVPGEIVTHEMNTSYQCASTVFNRVDCEYVRTSAGNDGETKSTESRNEYPK